MMHSTVSRLRSRGSLQTTRRRRRRIDLPRGRVFSQKGFGEGKRTKKERSTRKGVSYKQLKEEGVLDAQQGWFSVAKIADLRVQSTVLVAMKPFSVQGSRATCPVITSTGVALVLYRVGDEVFCSDANSTAYRFPMNDARIFDGPQGPAAECPFDGTTYDLRTGEVLPLLSESITVVLSAGPGMVSQKQSYEGCPRHPQSKICLEFMTQSRGVVWQSREDPKPLAMYDVVLATDGTIFTKIF